jgi:hypothetical protein
VTWDLSFTSLIQRAAHFVASHGTHADDEFTTKKGIKLNIIQCYAPTNDAEGEKL